MSSPPHTDRTLHERIQRLEDQLARVVSDAESEKETRSRVTQGLRDTIKEVQDEFRDVMYGPEGVIVHLDRLNEDKKNRQRMWQAINGLIIAVVGIISKLLFDLFRS